MPQLWNRYSGTYQEVKGGDPVWVVIPEKRVSGGMLKNKIRDMEVLASGSPHEYNYRAHESRILKCFEIISSEVSDANTIISVKKTARTPMVYPGMNVMVEPSKIDGTGKAATVTEVDESEEGKYKITVPSAGIDSAAAGKFLVEAAGAGTGVKMFCQPDNLTLDDTVGGRQNSVGVPRGMKYIYENMIPAMPKIVKDNIKFVEWEYFPEEK